MFNLGAAKSRLAANILPLSCGDRLRVHGLIVGSPEKKRADPAVLRGLCSHTLPSGKNEVGRGERGAWTDCMLHRGPLGL